MVLMLLSVILGWSVLLMDETGVLRENHQPLTNFIMSIKHTNGNKTHRFSCVKDRLHKLNTYTISLPLNMTDSNVQYA